MHDQNLPLPDYDNLPTGSLRHRIRSLTREEVRSLLDYEREHNNRPQVVEILNNRLAELDSGKSPTPGRQFDEPVEARDTPSGSPVSPSGSPEPIHPPPQGEMGLPGKPKGNRPRRQG